MIFVLNSHISCQSLKHSKEKTKKKKKKTKNPLSCHYFDIDAAFASRVNMQDNLITAPIEFDVTFDFAIYLCSQKYNSKIAQNVFR